MMKCSSRLQHSKAHPQKCSGKHPLQDDDSNPNGKFFSLWHLLTHSMRVVLVIGWVPSCNSLNCPDQTLHPSIHAHDPFFAASCILEGQHRITSEKGKNKIEKSLKTNF